MDYRQYIESNANVMLGKPVIKGTRLTVELVLQRLSEGVNTEQLKEAYPGLTNESLLAVFAYATDMVANENMLSVV
jgi:uncharacterized protein (DUF433 family)